MITITTKTPIQSAPPKPAATRQATQIQQLARDVASATGLAAKGAAYHRIADGVTDHRQATRLFETFYDGLAKADQTAVSRYFKGVTAAAAAQPTVVSPGTPPAVGNTPPGPVPVPPPVPLLAQGSASVAAVDPFASYIAAHPQVGSFLGQVSGQYGSQAGDAITYAKITVEQQQYGSQYDLFRAAQEATRTHQRISF